MIQEEPTGRPMQARYVKARQEREKRILSKASKADGFSNKDFGGHSQTLVEDTRRLTAEGKLFPTPSNGGWRYFTTTSLRDAFVMAKKKKCGRPAGMGTSNCAPWSANAKAHVPAHVKVQRVPTPPGRYEVKGPVVGGFMAEWRALRSA